MLRYLTYKLKTQSLNESESNSYQQTKNDDDHDSGTESDDEGADAEELEQYMDGRNLHHDGSSAPSDRASSTLETITDTDDRSTEERQQLSAASKTDVESPSLEPALDSALPSDSDHNFDHHSSEEELEVINCASAASLRERNSHHHPQYAEKRKWSQANNRLSFGENSASSDEEVRDLMCVSAPVEFRSSPPANVPKPSRSLSPPPKLFHASVANIPPHELCSVSPRKRHRRTLLTTNSTNNVQRPCLDFEKMQQVLSFVVRKRGQMRM